MEPAKTGEGTVNFGMAKMLRCAGLTFHEKNTRNAQKWADYYAAEAKQSSVEYQAALLAIGVKTKEQIKAEIDKAEIDKAEIDKAASMVAAARTEQQQAAVVHEWNGGDW